MPTIPILMPQLGESIAEATLVRILVEPGAQLEAGADLFEVETNKATMTVSSPCSGRVIQIVGKMQTSYAVGSNLASFEITDEDALQLGYSAPVPVTEDSTKKSNADSLHFQFSEEDNITSYQPKVEPVVGGLPVPAGATGASYISPRMRARMTELGLNASSFADAHCRGGFDEAQLEPSAGHCGQSGDAGCSIGTSAPHRSKTRPGALHYPCTGPRFG
jgi:pyruvate/2-oxoglutarate dehydrogenase complex dihydrolipoamide acyltransferase (E2) component